MVRNVHRTIRLIRAGENGGGGGGRHVWLCLVRRTMHSRTLVRHSAAFVLFIGLGIDSSTLSWGGGGGGGVGEHSQDRNPTL